MTKLKIDYDLVKYEMRKQGYTSDDMANLLGISVASFYHFINKSTVPSFYEKLYIMCEELDLSLEDITEVSLE